MQMAVMLVIGVAGCLHGLVATTFPMLVRMLSLVLLMSVRGDVMLVGVVAVRIMQMAVMLVVGVAGCLHGLMVIAFSMLVGMVSLVDSM